MRACRGQNHDHMLDTSLKIPIYYIQKIHSHAFPMLKRGYVWQRVRHLVRHLLLTRMRRQKTSIKIGEVLQHTKPVPLLQAMAETEFQLVMRRLMQPVIVRLEKWLCLQQESYNQTTFLQEIAEVQSQLHHISNSFKDQEAQRHEDSRQYRSCRIESGRFYDIAAPSSPSITETTPSTTPPHEVIDQIFPRFESESMRREAKKEGILLQRALEVVAETQACGDKKKVEQYSLLQEKHRRRRDLLNSQAAESIFQENNEEQSKGSVDLHGLFVSEALKKVEQSVDVR